MQIKSNINFYLNSYNITIERSEIMKKLFILYIIMLVLGFAFACGYYIYKIPKEETEIQEGQVSIIDLNMLK